MISTRIAIEKTTSRCLYYDAIKALAIYLVCAYHYSDLNFDIASTQTIETYANYFFHGLSSMAVPLFLMVNGALLLNKPYRLKSHLKKILYLYGLVYAWNAIYLTIWRLTGNDSFITVADFLSHWFYIENGISNHLWFLQVLISVYLLFPVIKQLYDQPQRQLLKLFFIIVFIFSFGNLMLNQLLNSVEFFTGINYLENDNFIFFPKINPFGSYSYTFVYFIGGGILAEKVNSDKTQVPTTWLIVSFVSALLALFAYGVLMTQSNGTLYDTVEYGYESIMTLVMSISAFFYLSQYAYTNRSLNRGLTLIGSNTLGIYLVHTLVGSSTYPYYEMFRFLSNLIPNILYTALVVSGSWWLLSIFKKVPFLRKLVTV